MLHHYVENINNEENLIKPNHMVRIRSSINDTTIPKVSLSFDTKELRCDWRGMVSALIYEESSVNDHQAQWVGGEDDGQARQISAKVQSGEMTMQEALIMAITAFGSQQDEGLQEARRTRIKKQLKKLHPDSEGLKTLETLKGQNWTGDQDSVKKLKEMRQMISMDEYSDDEEDEDEEDEDDEWEDEDGNENESLTEGEEE